eukprot:gene22234-26812_t
MTERSIQDNEYIYTDENGHVIRTTYRYILVIIDIFSKFVYAYPLETKQGLIISKILMKLFLSGDIPMILHSDNAIEFAKGHVKDVCDMFHVQQRFGDAYSPQTQGFVENKNKHIKDIIKYYFTYFKSYKFFDILDRIVFSINNTKHSVTGYTPMQIHKGREIPTRKNETVVEQVDEVNPCDVQLYSNSSEVFYKERTEKIQNILKYTADKKEEKLKVKQDFLNKNVKVFSYLKNDSSIIPILLRRVKNDYTELIENPIDIGRKPIDVVRFYKLVGKLKLSKSKYYPDVYKIKNVNDNKFTIVSQDSQYKIERFVNSQWTEVFHKNMFTVVKDTKVVDRPEYRFVDLQNKICKDTVDIVQKKRSSRKDIMLSQQQLIEILDSNILLSNPKPLIHYMFDSNRYEVIFAKSRQDDRLFEMSKVWMYFTEEVGELASAIRRQKNQFRDKKKVKLEAELGDVFSYLFQISYMLNIDLEQMWENQKVKMIKKKYYNINESSFKRGYITTNKKDLSNDDKETSTLQKSWKVVKK